MGSRVSDSPFLPVCPSLPATRGFSRGRVLGRPSGQQGMYAPGREPFTGREWRGSLGTSRGGPPLP